MLEPRLGQLYKVNFGFVAKLVGGMGARSYRGIKEKEVIFLVQIKPTPTLMELRWVHEDKVFVWLLEKDTWKDTFNKIFSVMS